ncbi:MAG: glycosyltransferase family 4 protein [Nitriliruptoraceae bacterium]
MRVAIVSPYDLSVPGGVQSHIEQLAAWLTAQGDQVLMLGPGQPPARPATPTTPGLVPLGRARGVPFNGSVAPIALGPATAAATIRALRALRPDVVHVHEPLVPMVGLGAVLGAPVPVVATFHAWSDRDRLYRAARPLGRAVLRRVAVPLAVSEAAAGYHARALGVPRTTFRTVPNGVDVARFAAAREAVGSERTPGPARLVFVGRLEPRKGALLLADAYLQLLKSHPDATLTIVGDGPERAELERRLAAVPGERAQLLGRVTGPELARQLAMADVAVAPALGGESFGIVLLEAMAAGTAVVAADLAGYRSVVTSGEDGILFPVGDVQQLGRALRDLLDDPGRRIQLVEAGTRTAAAHDWAVVADRVRGAYLDALTAARGRSGLR